jgi:hypothetical protein
MPFNDLLPSINGQYLLDKTLRKLGGYRNAVDVVDALDAINEAKDEVWAILKATKEDYFATFSQNTDSSLDNYFAALTTNSRKFDLPRNFRQMKGIQINDSGKEEIIFEPRDFADPEFQASYKASSTSTSTAARPTYFYDIIGVRTLILAQFPEAAFDITIIYIRAVADVDIDEELDEVLFPFTNAIATRAAADLASHTLHDNELGASLYEDWKEQKRSLESSAEQRDISKGRVVQDFQG